LCLSTLQFSIELFRVCSGALYNNVESVEERHRHRWEVNPTLVKQFEEKGFQFVGQDEEGQRMEIFELDSEYNQ
jgi:CTP synthase